MKYPLFANGTQARQTKERFAQPDEQLSYELGKAVQELPPLYTRLLAGTISAVVVGTIGWAHFSKVEEVATAPGEIAAASQLRPITALGNGTIVSVNVTEGEQVNKGEVLIQRDPDLQQADVARLTKSERLIREDLRRLDAERTGSEITGTTLQDELLQSRLQDYQSQQTAAKAEADRQSASIEQAKVRLSLLTENLQNAKTSFVNSKTNLANAESIREKVASNVAIAQKRERSLSKLTNSGAVPRLDYLDAQDRLNRANAEITRASDEIINARNKVTEAQDKVTSLEKEIAGQQQAILQAQAAYEAANTQAQRLGSERRSQILTEIKQRQEELTTVSGQLAQAKKQQDLETIQSPVTGVVYQVKATKGPVQAGEELLSILPSGENLLLEVKVLNRDIGFVHQGMKAKVKLATFPFQEFGTIKGEVTQVSPKAIVDEELGLVFPTKIKLNKNTVIVRGEEVPLTPGMAATGEIVTRQKSILTFIIEPVTRRFSEAFTVR